MQYVPGNFFGPLFKGGVAYLSKDYLAIMELLIDSEVKMFKGIKTPVIFLQNAITDLLLGLRADEVLIAYHQYIKKKYDAKAAFITMNMPKLLDVLEKGGVQNPIICSQRRGACPHAPEQTDILHFKDQQVWSCEGPGVLKYFP